MILGESRPKSSLTFALVAHGVNLWPPSRADGSKQRRYWVAGECTS